MRWFLSAFCLASALLTPRLSLAQFSAADAQKVIYPLNRGGTGSQEFPCSPHRKFCVLPISWGDLKTGRLVASAAIYETGKLEEFVLEPALAPPPAIAKLRFESEIPTSTKVIAQWKWSSDGTCAFFLARSRLHNDVQQIYTYDINRHQLRALTKSATPITFFQLAGDDRTVIYSAREPAHSPEAMRHRQQHGFVVASEPIWEALGATNWDASFFKLDVRTKKVTRLDVRDPYGNTAPKISLSPSGEWALITHYTRSIPARWVNYPGETLMLEPGKFVGEGTEELVRPLVITGDFFDQIQRSTLVNLRNFKERELLDAPADDSAYSWSGDGTSVVVTHPTLPLSMCTPGRCRYTDEIQLRVRLDNGDLQIEALKKELAEWNDTRLISVESLNGPPEIWAELKGGQRRQLTEMNTAVAAILPGQTRTITWKMGNLPAGISTSSPLGVQAGLMLPSSYRDGDKIPFVIQLYGFSEQIFWLKGPSSSAFSARALSARGIGVLQFGCNLIGYSSETDEPLTARCIESAIDALDDIGVVDRSKVGLIGFSRSGSWVMEAVTFSNYPIAAATIADSVAFTPFGHSVNTGSGQAGLLEYDTPDLGGGSLPQSFGSQFIGNGTASWFRRSPVFHLDKVTTPVRFETNGNFPAYWDISIFLRRARRPAEYVIFTNEQHSLEAPWAQFASQQGNVDWFAFWLKGETRTKPIPNASETRESLRDQYDRWRALRADQETVVNKAAQNNLRFTSLPPLQEFEYVQAK